MNTKNSHKLIAAGGMAAVIALATAVFFLRSPTVAPVAQVEAPTAPVAETTAAILDAVAEVPAAPAPAADVPVTPAVTPLNDAAGQKKSERTVMPMADAKPPRHRDAAPADSPVVASSRTVARSESVSIVTDNPTAPAATVEPVNAPMTASAPAVSPDTGASEKLATSDSRITTEVKTAIATEGVAKDASIAVTTTDGVVALSGSVPSQETIEQVKDVAAKVRDVKRVDTSGLILASL